jgi:hypothetical protein
LVMSWPRWLNVVLSSQRPWFAPGLFNVENVMAQGQFFSKFLGFSLLLSFHLSSRFTHISSGDGKRVHSVARSEFPKCPI